MKFLTVCQPYAEMLARGPEVKPAENRRWATRYRGPLAIHAGKSQSWLDPEDIAIYPEMVFGAVVCVGVLVACLDVDEPWPTKYDAVKRHIETFGPYCLIVENVQRLARPVVCTGAQGLWVPKPHEAARVLSEIRAQIGVAA